MRRALVVLLALLALAPAAALAQGRTYVPFQAFTAASTGATFSVPIILPAGSVAAPALQINGTQGFYSAGGNQINLSLAAGAYHNWTISTYHINNSAAMLQLSDVLIQRVSNGVLRQYNGANPQEYQLHNTFTDTSNYERAFVRWSSNIFVIGTEAAGTGAARSIAFAPGGTNRWFMHPSTFAFYPGADGQLDIGGGTNKIQSFYVATSIQGNKSKTLTETSATPVVQIAVPSGGHTSGTIYGEVYCADATDFVTYYNEWRFTCHNKAGTEACSNPTAASTAVSSASSGGSISAFTWSVDTSPTNAVNLSVNTTCSLTQTTLEFHYRVHLLDPQTVTPQ